MPNLEHYKVGLELCNLVVGIFTGLGQDCCHMVVDALEVFLECLRGDGELLLVYVVGINDGLFHSLDFSFNAGFFDKAGNPGLDL